MGIWVKNNKNMYHFGSKITNPAVYDVNNNYHAIAPSIELDTFYEFDWVMYKTSGSSRQADRYFLEILQDGVQILQMENFAASEEPNGVLNVGHIAWRSMDATIETLRVQSPVGEVNWNAWTGFSACSKTCSEPGSLGQTIRTRTCPVAGRCSTSIIGDTESRVCNTDLCVLYTPCNCPDNSIRCKDAVCRKGESCELTTWFEEKPSDNVYACHQKTHRTCSCWGDPHIVTFDNAKSDVYGVAQYLFAGHNGTEYPNGTMEIPPFNVLMNTYKFNKVSALDYIYLKFQRCKDDEEMIEIETHRHGRRIITLSQTELGKNYCLRERIKNLP